MNQSSEFPTITEDEKEKWRTTISGAGKLEGNPSPIVMEAMLGSVCHTCNEPFQKANWLQDAKYCSKECRKERIAKKRGEKKINKMIPSMETEQKFAPIKAKAWHSILGMMIDVTAIDWPANKIYGTIPSKNNYPMNFLLNECTVVSNVGGYVDRNGVDIFEGSVCHLSWEDTEGTTGGSVTGVVGFDKAVGSLFLVERTDSEDKRRFMITDKNTKDITVLGDMFTFQGVAGAAKIIPDEVDESEDEEMVDVEQS